MDKCKSLIILWENSLLIACHVSKHVFQVGWNSLNLLLLFQKLWKNSRTQAKFLWDPSPWIPYQPMQRLAWHSHPCITSYNIRFFYSLTPLFEHVHFKYFIKHWAWITFDALLLVFWAYRWGHFGNALLVQTRSLSTNNIRHMWSLFLMIHLFWIVHRNVVVKNGQQITYVLQ